MNLWHDHISTIPLPPKATFEIHFDNILVPVKKIGKQGWETMQYRSKSTVLFMLPYWIRILKIFNIQSMQYLP